MKLILSCFILVLAGCATTGEPAKFSHTAELGVRAYNIGNPGLAVVLLRPGVMAYLNQDTTAYLSEGNLSEVEFNKSIDYLLVSAWESENTELFQWLFTRYSVDMHDSFKDKGTVIGDYGKVRIKRLWECIELEKDTVELLEAANCWRSIGNKERSMDNFKANYIYKNAGGRVSH
jgi:hypothetical protein